MPHPTAERPWFTFDAPSDQDLNFTGDSYAFKCFYDYAPREYCVQYGETSLHFISRLCEEEGIYFYIEHSSDRHVLCFSDREGGPPIGGESRLRYHPGAGTETDTALVREVELHQAIGRDAFTFREWNFEKTRLDLQVGQAETDSVKAPGGGGFNELRVEDMKGQEEIFVHAENDVNVHVKNDWKEHVLRDQHRTVGHFSYSLVKGEDQQTVEKARKVEILADDHLTVRASSHGSIGEKWLLRSGGEFHVKSGIKTVFEAGTELTLKVGGSFIKLDPSGVTIGGPAVKMNAGGGPGRRTGARPRLPLSAVVPGIDSFNPDDCDVSRQHDATVSARQTGLPICAACAACLEEQ